MKDNALKRYIRKVKRTYTGKRVAKKAFICELEDSITRYMESNPNSSYSDIVENFGDPADVIELESLYVNESLHKRNMYLYWTTIVACIAVVVITLFFTIRYVVFMYDYSQGHYEEYFEDDVIDENVNDTDSTDTGITIEFD